MIVLCQYMRRNINYLLLLLCVVLHIYKQKKKNVCIQKQKNIRGEIQKKVQTIYLIVVAIMLYIHI